MKFLHFLLVMLVSSSSYAESFNFDSDKIATTPSDWISGFSYKIFWKQYRFFKEHILGKEQAIPVPNIPTPNIPVPEGPRIPGKTV